jgi:hypothetical protein
MSVDLMDNLFKVQRAMLLGDIRKNAGENLRGSRR